MSDILCSPGILSAVCGENVLFKYIRTLWAGGKHHWNHDYIHLLCWWRTNEKPSSSVISRIASNAFNNVLFNLLIQYNFARCTQCFFQWNENDSKMKNESVFQRIIYCNDKANWIGLFSEQGVFTPGGILLSVNSIYFGYRIRHPNEFTSFSHFLSIWNNVKPTKSYMKKKNAFNRFKLLWFA